MLSSAVMQDCEETSRRNKILKCYRAVREGMQRELLKLLAALSCCPKEINFPYLLTYFSFHVLILLSNYLVVLGEYKRIWREPESSCSKNAKNSSIGTTITGRSPI